MILVLAYRNLLRHKARTLAALIAIVFGVAGLIVSGGFVRDMYTQLAEALIHSQSGHLQLAMTGYFSSGSRSPELYRIDDLQRVRESIERSVPHVRDAMARIHFTGLLGNGRSDWGVVAEGVEPAREAKLATHLRLTSGRALTAGDGFAMMVGEGVAQALGLAPGARVSLLASTDDGALNALEFVVVGVFQSFSKDFDARAVRVPLGAAQTLLLTRGANVVVLELEATRYTASTAALLAERFHGHLEVKTWRDLNDFYDKTVTLYERQFGVLQLIVLAMVLLCVANAINITIFERVGEFGTMRALGNSGTFVLKLILTESAALGLAGSALGAVLGASLALGVSEIGIPMPPPPNANLGYSAAIQLSPGMVVGAMLVGVCSTIGAGLYPGWRASRLTIADALRRNL